MLTDRIKNSLLRSLPIFDGFIETLNDTIEAPNGWAFLSFFLMARINPSPSDGCRLGKLLQFSFLLGLDLLHFHPMLFLHFMFSEVPCDPGPTHGVDIGIENDRIKMPNDDGKGS